MRTLKQAREIVGSYTTDAAALGYESVDSDGHTSEDRLGCSLASHQAWMREATKRELADWAEDWARGEEREAE
jgi:hypothetical protein